MLAPTAAPEVPQTIVDVSPEQYLVMLDASIAILKSEYLAALYVRAEKAKHGDVQVRKAQFMRAAGRLGKDGPLPPMTECALVMVVGSRAKH